MTKASDLQGTEYNEYYSQYIGLVPKDETLLQALISGRDECINFFRNVDVHKLDFRYAEGKWTPKEILLHVIDAERVFSYRALRFARKDTTPVQGFDQDDYVKPSKAYSRSLDSLLDEYQSVREATISLFKSMDNEMLASIGVASGSELSARAAGFIVAGHDRSHINIIKERYL